MEYKTLNNGVKMPILGIGVYDIPERETRRVVEEAVSVGYRSIDTAAMYIMSELLAMRYAHVAFRGKNSLSPPRYAIRATLGKKRSARLTTP